MKINYTIKIGSVVLATLLTGLMNSCASHEIGVVTPINLPKVQHTLAAPKSLEGAWIGLTSYDRENRQTNWWYIKNGKAYYYGIVVVTADGGSFSYGDVSETADNGHPVSPTSIDASGDNLGRGCSLSFYTYVPTGATAKLYIRNNDRHETTLCRSASKDSAGVYDFSNEPALITVKSANQGVYKGTIKGIIGNWCTRMERADSITIFTK